MALSRGLHAHLLQKDIEKKSNFIRAKSGCKKKKIIAPNLFLYYELSVCPLILNYNKVYLAASLIAKPNKRATVIDFDSELQRNFANRLCPVGWQACRYDQNQVDADPSIEDTCISLTELNEFAECQQGCEETFPADDPDYFEYDLIDQIDISALGERSDSIIGSSDDLQKRCGTRSFKGGSVEEWLCKKKLTIRQIRV